MSNTTAIEEIAQLQGQLATARAMEDFWRDELVKSEKLIGRIDYALEQIATAQGIRNARRWAKQMRNEIKERTGK